MAFFFVYALSLKYYCYSLLTASLLIENTITYFEKIFFYISQKKEKNMSAVMPSDFLSRSFCTSRPIAVKIY